MLGLYAFAHYHAVYFGLKYAAAMTALMIGIPLYIKRGKLGELAKSAP